MDLHIEEKITGGRIKPSRIRGIFEVYRAIWEKVNSKERFRKGIQLPLLYLLHYNNFEGVYIENVSKLRKRVRPEKSFCREMVAFCRKMGFEKDQVQFYDAGDDSVYIYIDPYLCPRADILEINFASNYINLQIDDSLKEECHRRIQQKLNSVNMMSIESLKEIFKDLADDDKRERAKKMNYLSHVLNVWLDNYGEPTFEVKIEAVHQNQTSLVTQFYERVPELLKSWRIQEAKDAVYWKVVKIFQEEQTTCVREFEEACLSICEVFLAAEEF